MHQRQHGATLLEILLMLTAMLGGANGLAYCQSSDAVTGAGRMIAQRTTAVTEAAATAATVALSAWSQGVTA